MAPPQTPMAAAGPFDAAWVALEETMLNETGSVFSWFSTDVSLGCFAKPQIVVIAAEK